jgi:hypothetical protein
MQYLRQLSSNVRDRITGQHSKNVKCAELIERCERDIAAAMPAINEFENFMVDIGYGEIHRNGIHVTINEPSVVLFLRNAQMVIEAFNKIQAFKTPAVLKILNSEQQTKSEAFRDLINMAGITDERRLYKSRYTQKDVIVLIDDFKEPVLSPDEINDMIKDVDRRLRASINAMHGEAEELLQVEPKCNDWFARLKHYPDDLHDVQIQLIECYESNPDSVLNKRIAKIIFNDMPECKRNKSRIATIIEFMERLGPDVATKKLELEKLVAKISRKRSSGGRSSRSSRSSSGGNHRPAHRRAHRSRRL